MVNNYYASSPILIPHASSALPSTSTKRYISKYPTPPSLNYLARTSNGVAGRKRSRDGEDDHDSEMEASSRPSIVQTPEPVMGPGMTLIYPDNPSLNIAAESQSGTWLEERADSFDVSRPRLIARKSRCLIGDLPEIQSMVNDQQQIDPLARQLGIGWKRLSEQQQSAIAGSETFIRRQFDMVDPKIILHHEGLGLFLAKSEPQSAQGYWTQWWLFREDLNSCRFLCNDDNQLFSRLSNKRQDERSQWVPDIRCEGPELFAKDAKTRETTLTKSLNSVTNQPPQFKEDVFSSDASMNTETAVVAPDGDVEMS
jgi:hypothetical protein